MSSELAELPYSPVTVAVESAPSGTGGPGQINMQQLEPFVMSQLTSCFTTLLSGPVSRGHCH